MYLKNIVIKNIGPIEELSVELPFKENGSPKPIVFVGENGSGKTILQSQIIDSFYEIGSSLFGDVGIQDGLQRKFYKLSGGSLNLQTGKDKGFSLLRFIYNNTETLDYFDKGGDVKKEDFTKYLKDFSLSPSGKNDNQKQIAYINDEVKEELKDEWRRGVHFYQPAYRYEEPFWKNDDFVDYTRFEDKKRFSGKLGKNLEIISSTKDNKTFLMDLVLDFTNNPNNITDQLTWASINDILRKIKKKENIRFGVGPRGGYRVSIVSIDRINGDMFEQLLPSIDNLSLGESILFNLFINIIRYGDNPPKNTRDIQGIVAIDEIDVHLHTDLQNSVLPELIQLFPKVQFIITTHSPLFLLGMKKTFGEDGFEVRNMPKGEIITTERFSEFENAYRVLKETEKFENEIKEKVKNNKKPILLLEGKTDKQIFEKAWEKIRGADSVLPFFINDIDTGHNANQLKFALERANLFQNEKVLGIFDFDQEGYNQWSGLKFDTTESHKIKKHKDKEYYALLLPCLEKEFADSELKNQIYDRDNKSLEHQTVFSLEHMFYDYLSEEQREYYFTKKNLYGGNVIIAKKDKKQYFADWICKNGTQEHFKNFESIFSIIEECLRARSNLLV